MTAASRPSSGSTPSYCGRIDTRGRLTSRAWSSDDIGKARPRLHEPSVPKGEDRARHQRDAQPSSPVGSLVPDERPPEALHDLGQRVDVHERAEPLRNCIDAIEDGGEEDQDLSENGDRVGDVAQVDAERCEEPADT